MPRGWRKPIGPGWRHRGERRALARECSDDAGGLRWSPMIGDVPCWSEGEREVSELHGLGEERLRGRRIEEREESGCAGQIRMVDGASVLGRAMGRLAREGGAQLRWLGCGREGKGRNGDGMAVGVRFERNWLGGAGREREKGGSAWARPRGGGRRRREGGSGIAIDGAGQPATASNRWAQVAALPQKQRRAVSVGDAGKGG
jgi:hypothetical protein